MRATDAPVIVKTKALIAAAPPGRQVLSLAQGVVHWPPPPAALQVAGQLLAANDASVHLYGPDEGLPGLRAALAAKVASQNGLHGVRARDAGWRSSMLRSEHARALAALQTRWRVTHRNLDTPCARFFLQYEVMVTAGANQGFTNLVGGLRRSWQQPHLVAAAVLAIARQQHQQRQRQRQPPPCAPTDANAIFPPLVRPGGGAV